MSPASIPLEVPEKPYEIQIIQESDRRREKFFTVKVLSDGDPSQTTLARWERFCFGMLDLAKRVGLDRA